MVALTKSAFVAATILIVHGSSIAQTSVELPKLLEQLRSAGPETSPQIMKVIAGQGADAVPALIHALDIPSDLKLSSPGDSILADRAQRILSAIGRPAVPALINALGHKNSLVRARAAQALRGVRPPPSEAVPALIGALRDTGEFVRGHAIQAVGFIGPPAADAVPALIVILKTDENERYRKSAAWALGEIGSAQGVPALTAALGDKDPDVRREAQQALTRIK